jgi:hypothetical protein
MKRPLKKPGYHLTEIPKGVIGESSKILEELLELQDAEAQDAKVMALVELSDMIGAVDHYLRRHFPDMTMRDLIAMSDITQRAFRNGRRT